MNIPTNPILEGLSISTLLNLKHSLDDKLHITHSGPAENGKYSGWITNPKGQPIINTKPNFNSPEEAEEHIRKIVAATREWKNKDQTTLNPKFHILQHFGDFWVTTTQENKTKIINFFYHDEAKIKSIQELLHNLAATQENCVEVPILDLSQSFKEGNGTYWIQSPLTQKIYEEESEGECLRSLLEEEGYPGLQALAPQENNVPA